MTPTAEGGGNLPGTRREAGFLLGEHEQLALDDIPTKAGEPAAAAKRDAPRFSSILFATPAERTDATEAPEFFADLNCDQIVDAVTAGKDEYDLKPFFYAPLRRVEAIHYRQEIMKDLECRSVYQCITSFAGRMRDVRDHLTNRQKAHYQEQKQSWFLDGVEIYCDTIEYLAAGLSASNLKSRGLISFRDYLQHYAHSDRFHSILTQTKTLKSKLAAIKYCVLIRPGGFMVRKCESEADYSTEVEETFEKFKQGAAKDYRVKFPGGVDMNHIEGKILEFVAKLYPDTFAPLSGFCDVNENFIDATVATFDREVQFYVAYLEYIAGLKRGGLQFCYPKVSDKTKEVFNFDGFDVALAQRLLNEKSPLVCNDFCLKDEERILVVSGPNQGGKTTFARTFGQLHYLANLGCPVPGREAQLFLFDRLFTHFEKQEKVENLRGKLEDDLVRVREILGGATSESIIILNEVFTSTTVQDETYLSERVMEKVIELDVLCVWVSFVDELASYGPQVVSMMSTVVPENPAVRTFKIMRRPADGLAHAMAIAEKHRVTYEAIRKRIDA
jgi:DNA mismatch repair protein MutS